MIQSTSGIQQELPIGLSHQVLPEAIWPPSYHIRKSKRAKYIRLRITPHRGLELIVPRHFKPKDTLTILEEKKHWIQKTLQKVHYAKLQQEPTSMPTQIHLAALEQNWQIHYQATDMASPNLQQTELSQLLIRGNLHEWRPIKNSLIRWLFQQAELHLKTWLTELSQQLEMPFTTVKIRWSKTRWGSCSATKTICLSISLLFLPRDLVQHVLIHELCHTRHLNHSERFWQLVKQHDANYLQLRKQLRTAGSLLPIWLLADETKK